jgi:hypothetical protein
MESSKMETAAIEQLTAFVTANVSKQKLEKLLERWANIALPGTRSNPSDPAYNDEARKLMKAFPDMFLSEKAFSSEHFLRFATIPARPSEKLLGADALHRAYLSVVARFAGRLRVVWDAPNEEFKRKQFAWLHYWILELFIHPQSDYSPAVLIEEGNMANMCSDPLDYLLLAMGENLHRLKRCPNPSCKAPYFLATKGPSKFCSTACADYGRKLNQSRYWLSAGSEKRKERMAEVRRKKAARQTKSRSKH